MSDSGILHHRARGIHPGAFVQPTLPNTADVQDGVLWLDTSAGPPYQLKRWDAGGAAWRVVQMDATGYPLPGGHRLEVHSGLLEANSNQSGVIEIGADTTETIITGLDLSVGSGHATLTLVWDVWVSLWHLFVDKEAALRVRRSNVTGTILASHTLEPGADVPDSDSQAGHFFEWADHYVDTAPTDGHYVMTIQSTLGTGTRFFSDTRRFQITGGADGIRLLHANGSVCWEHNSTTGRIFAAGAEVLRTPFPVLAGQPLQVLGRNATTDLPAWNEMTPPPPPAPPVHDTFSMPDNTITGTDDYPDPPPAPPPDAQRVCGAAEEMANTLVRIYDAIIFLINNAKSDILSAFTGTLKKELSAQLISLLTEAELAQFEIDAVQLVADILLAAADALIGLATKLPKISHAQMLPPSGDSIYQVIRNCAWQALWLTAGDYFLESASSNGRGTRDNWQLYMNADWSFFAGSTIPGIDADHLPWQLIMLDGIIKNVPDTTWKDAAWTGANRPSTQCSGATGYPP